jgi:hypothetical protein
LRKALIALLLVAGLFSTGYAGTLTNHDFQEYHLIVRYPDGRRDHMIVPASSTINGFCAYDGCSVRLVESWDRAYVGPNDDVDIFYGLLRVRRALFPYPG